MAEEVLRKARRMKQWLSGNGVLREDSDDELGDDDIPWEWVYADASPGPQDDENIDPKAELAGGKTGSKKRTLGDAQRTIVGARIGKFHCRVGDTVLLKANMQQAWVGIIGHFFEDADSGEKMANFMWFSAEQEIRNRGKKRTDFCENELYITPSWDDNPLAAINGKAKVMSMQVFKENFPSGKLPAKSKDQGKVFVCRRGCNTRTATYTDEFIWEDIYQGVADLHGLINRVQSQTKATRKRRTDIARDRTADKHDDFILNDGSIDEGLPQTPRKRRKLNANGTPGSKGKDRRPRSNLCTPTHPRILVKKPLEFTPLGTRTLSPTVLASPYHMARNQLHASAVPVSLPCREEEFATVYAHLEAAITEGTGACIYISGTPGTGKTATVRDVVGQLLGAVAAEELDDFVFVEINGMKITDPYQSYSILWEALRGDRLSPAHALDLLEREFSTPSPRRVPCVVLMDELDQLVTKNQSLMYNFFNWPVLRYSRLVVVAIANTMDLPERMLSNKISSRLGLTRITFPGYTHDQLVQIISSRLANVKGKIVHPDAIQFASRKVAAVSGDARRALEICRRAIELAEKAALTQSREKRIEDDVEKLPDTPSKSNRKAKQDSDVSTPKPNQPIGMVSIATIKAAISEATNNPLSRHLRRLPVSAKLALGAISARMRRTGLAESTIGDVVDEARKLAETSTNKSIVALMNRASPYINAKAAASVTDKSAKDVGKGARCLGTSLALSLLTDAGIVIVERRCGERVGKLRLAVSEENVTAALKNDKEAEGLGFG